MSLATAGIYCRLRQVCLFRVRWKTVPKSRPSSCKSSIVEDVHITTYNACSARCGTYRLVVARENPQKDGGRWLGTITTMVKCQNDRWTSVASLKSMHWCTGSQCSWRSTGVMSNTGNQTGGGVLYRLQPIHQAFRYAEEQRVAVVQATGDECLD